MPDGATIAPRLIMPLGLSYDHRVIDGAMAARFMAQLRELLEQPEKLLMGL
jgi:pyruvate dehydrogenase E2 component (dihydrolipoamide acetyltransferase)